MGIILTILLFMVSQSLNAERHLFIINQNQDIFHKDAALWISYFSERYDNLKINKLTKYTNTEAADYIYNYGVNLNQYDTLIIIVSAHSYVGSEKNFVILEAEGDNVNIANHVIFQYTWEYWLKYLESKKIRTLAFLLVCDPSQIINRHLAAGFKNITLVYGTNKSEFFHYESIGSIMAITMPWINHPDMLSYIVYFSNEWKDKRYYPQINTNIPGKALNDIYPIEPIMFGPNFYF